MISYSLFVVDDEPSILESITLNMEDRYRVTTFTNAESALCAMQDCCPDLVLLDVGLPGMSGIRALELIKSSHPETLVIMITAYEDVNTVITAMKLGAYDYVVKPLYMEGLEVTIANGLETIRLRKEVRQLQEAQLRENLPCFVVKSALMQNIMEYLSSIAQSPDTPVLILGETGTGKELIAKAIHYRSPNFRGPLITVNCAAIPKDLIESELFGYEEGAFSGAKRTGKIGQVEEAAGGTLFLDEVGDLSPEAQAKLLRFLEYGEFHRLGGTKSLKISTRIVSATNQDLKKMIREGTFRNDLYFRLGVIRVELPSLDERPDDIMPMAAQFLIDFNKKFGKHVAGFSKEAEEALLSHQWTGNVRELKNLIERAVLVSKRDLLLPEDLGLDAPRKPLWSSGQEAGFALPPVPPEGIDLPSIEESVEKYYLQQALILAQGNESKAARLLNLNHHTFRYRRKRAFS